MLRGYGWLIASAALAAGAGLAACTGDEFLVGGGGSDGSGGATGSTGVTGTGTPASTGTDAASTGTASTVSTGTGACAGCTLGGVCQTGNDATACGPVGTECQVCGVPNACQTATCSAQVCGTAPLDGASCSYVENEPFSGICAGGQCTPNPEDCLNGVDDEDEDDLIDCNDHDSCDGGFACFPTFDDAEWTGPVAFYLGDVACPDVWDTEVTGTFGAGGVVGGDCTCSCTPNCDATYEVALGACGTEGTSETISADDCVLAIPAAGALQNASKAASTEGCDSVGEPPTPSFAMPATLCARDEAGAGCDDGSCRARAPLVSEVEGRICVYQEGDNDDVTCPEGLNTKIEIESIVEDDRTCACTCTDNCDDGEIEFFDDAACTGCDAAANCGSLPINDESGCAAELPETGMVYAKWNIVAECESDNPTVPATGDATTTTLTLCCL